MSGEREKNTKPGPEADRVKLEGDWQDRLKEALEKKRPEGGWPKPEPREKRQKGKKRAGKQRG